jgi:hypothetical protein
MADVYNAQDDQNEDPQKKNQTTGESSLVGSSSAQVGGASATPSAAGVGKGGTGGYTNIQSYLGANQGDTGSAQNLEKTTAPTFDNESQNIQKQSTDYVNNAQKQLDDNSIDKTKAESIVKEAAGNYTYGAPQNDSYNQSVSKVQNALNGQYSGPTSYNYAIGADAQNLGSQLKDPGGFDTLMGNVYSNAAGKSLSQGQFALQKQFDVNNSALQDTRNNLLNKYSGLEKQRDDTVTDTTQKLGGLAEQYRNNQSSLKDYLLNQSNSLDTSEAQAEANAKAAYNALYTGRSGRDSSFANLESDGDRNAVGLNGGNPEVWLGNMNRLRDNGIWQGDPSNLHVGDGKNLSWAQLQKEHDLAQNTYALGELGARARSANAGTGHTIRNNFLDNGSALTNFYNTQDAQYANTGDEQKRSYNAIQDFLNSTAARKEQGFKVRG